MKFLQRLSLVVLLGTATALTPLVAQTVADEAAPEVGLKIPDGQQLFGKNDPNLRRATARVNGEIITGTEVDHRLALILAANDNKLPPEEIDRFRVQIITNLINNALVHAFDGRQNGKITIVATVERTGCVNIAVKDDGVGIAPIHVDKVFDPFFTTKLGRGGSGLGLNIVYNLVTTTLGGRIVVVSELGQGACFTLSLPLRVDRPAVEFVI